MVQKPLNLGNNQSPFRSFGSPGSVIYLPLPTVLSLCSVTVGFVRVALRAFSESEESRGRLITSMCYPVLNHAKKRGYLLFKNRYRGKYSLQNPLSKIHRSVIVLLVLSSTLIINSINSYHQPHNQPYLTYFYP